MNVAAEERGGNGDDKVAAKTTKNSFVVSEVDGGMVTLVSDCLHVVEWPMSLLPFDAKKGMVLTFDIVRNSAAEMDREKSMDSMQEELTQACRNQQRQLCDSSQRGI